MKRFAILGLALLASACSNEAAGVRLTHDAPASTAPAVAPVARNEPVFYNGKVYQVALQPEAGGYGLNVSGMTAAQQKDAIAVATSTLHHFTCRDSQKARFSTQPSYASGLWQFHGNCG
jgi:PBP1b-binding outer membrane lipoprotein LpoB